VIAGAGIHVLPIEPPQKDNPLFTAKKSIITPHITWATREARGRLMEISISNLAALFNGHAVDVVNK
jgi:glycerate dehydrogenase